MKSRVQFLVWVVVVCVSGLASADIEIESYDGDRPIDADSILTLFRSTLEAHGVIVTGPAITDAVEALPLPPNRDSTMTRTELVERVNKGAADADDADSQKAASAVAAQLESVLLAARNNAGVVASDPASREWMTKAMAALAFSEGRIAKFAKQDAVAKKRANQLADEALDEQIRSYPEYIVTENQFGPEVASRYVAEKARLAALPPGTLTVTVSRSDAKIYINEFERGRGSVTRKDLPLGKYRILVTVAGVGRLYKVTVGGTSRTLMIDWNADSAFTITKEWAGYLWPRGHADLPNTAPRRARASIPHRVIVAEIVAIDGRRYANATKYNNNGDVMAEGAVVLDGQDQERRMIALARLMMIDDVPTSSLPPAIVMMPGRKLVVPRPPTASPTKPPTSPPPAKVAVSTRPTPVEPLHEQPIPQRDPSPRPDAPPASAGPIDPAHGQVDTTPGGSGSELRWPAYVAGGVGFAALAAGGYLLYIDGKSTCGSEVARGDCRYLHDTAAAGWSFVGGGAAAVAFGVYWYFTHQEPAENHHIGVLPTRGGGLATVGWRF